MKLMLLKIVLVLLFCTTSSCLGMAHSKTYENLETYFAIEEEQVKRFDLKDKVTAFLVQTSSHYPTTTIKDLYNTQQNEKREESERSATPLGKLIAKIKSNTYQDIIYKADQNELPNLFPLCYLQKKDSELYEAHPDCCIRDLRVCLSRGVDRTLAPIDIFTTHGTWGQNNPDFDLKNFEKLGTIMSSYHNRPVRIFSVFWNGQDSKTARKNSAQLLAKIIKQLNNYYIGFIGFSHGVNFFNLTSMQLPPLQALFSICLARPNLDSICEEQNSKHIPFVISIQSKYDTVMPIAESWESFKSWIWGGCCKEENETISLISSAVDLRIDTYRPSHVKTPSIIPQIPDLLIEMVTHYHHIDALKKLSFTFIPKKLAEEHGVNPINLTLTESIMELPEEIKESHEKAKEEFKKVYNQDVRKEDSYVYALFCRLYNICQSITPRF